MALTRRFALILFALVAALALSFAACGGDDDDSGDDDSDAVTASAQADDDDGDETPAGDDDDDGSDDDDDATPEGDDDDDDDGGNGELDLCELITVEEASNAAGVPFEEGVNSDDSDEIFGCDWDSESPGAIGALYLEVRTGSDEDRQAYYDLLDEVEAVPDLGEEAKWNSGLSLLEVMGDDHYLSIQLINFELGDEVTKQNSIDFANLVLDKLGE